MVDYKKPNVNVSVGPELPPTVKVVAEETNQDDLRQQIFCALLSGAVMKHGLPHYVTATPSNVATRTKELMTATEKILTAINENLKGDA